LVKPAKTIFNINIALVGECIRELEDVAIMCSDHVWRGAMKFNSSGQ
jgi:hypothetical protein